MRDGYKSRAMSVMSRRVAIPAAIRRDLWMVHFGTAGIVPCPVCLTRNITPFEFEAGHKVSVAHGGGSDIGNLVPICGLCNKSMGARDIDEYMAHNKITPRSPIYVCRDVEMAPPVAEQPIPLVPAADEVVSCSPGVDNALNRELRAYHAAIAQLFDGQREWGRERAEYERDFLGYFIAELARDDAKLHGAYFEGAVAICRSAQDIRAKLAQVRASDGGIARADVGWPQLVQYIHDLVVGLRKLKRDQGRGITRDDLMKPLNRTRLI